MQAIKKIYPQPEGGAIYTPEQITEQLFQRMDKNQDGQLSLSEFVEGAKSDMSLVNILHGDIKF